MENENKWEYDYSSANNSQNTAGETGYPNVGSSGMNTANTAATYGEADATNPEYTAPRQDSGNGGVTPPPAGPEQNAAAPGQPKKQKKDHSKLAKSAVALVLAAAMGFVGGYNGQLFQSLITTPGITPAFTQVRGETRCCINVRDRETNQSTEFLEPGNPVSQEELERFLADYQSQLGQAEVVAISGSMPKGVPGDFYATLCRLAKAQSKKVIVDSSGSALREALPGGPDLVKPNDEELCQLTGQDTSTVEGCIQAAQSLRALGAGAVAVSRGKDGVLVVSPQGVYQGRPPRIQVVNTVGCGDSMVAGFATGFAQGWELPQVIRYAVAISAANALTKETGCFQPEDLERLLPQVTVEQLEH